MRSPSFLLSLALTAGPAFAQCFDPVYGTPITPAAALTGDIVLPSTPLGISIGFPFPLGAATYGELHIADKGYVLLSNNGVPLAPTFADITATALELVTGPPTIAALWSDLQTLDTNNGMIYVKSTPQVCVVTWENITCFDDNCGLFDMQLQLYPSGAVWCFYGNGATNNSDPAVPAWQVGVCGVSPGGAATSALVDLSGTGAVTEAAIAEEWLVANTFDLAGGGVGFLPSGTGWVYLQSTGCAAVELYGTGCVQRSDSVYEEFPSSFDLGNTTLTWLRTSNGYVCVNTIPGTFVAPGAGALAVATGQLDGEQFFPLTQPMVVGGAVATGLNVTTKGMVEVATGPTGNIDFSPSADELLAWPTTVFACWMDYDQTQAGSITFEQTGGVAYVTWNAVETVSAGGPNTFQFQFDGNTGNVTLVLGAMTGTGGFDPILVGSSIAGASLDLGATDLSTPGLAVTALDAEVRPLALSYSGLPIVGTSAFSFVLENVPNVLPLGLLAFGDQQINPGFDLTFLGMAGCFAYSNLNFGSVSVSTLGGAGSIVLPIPNNPLLVGFEFTSQVVALSLDTALNVVSSNGMRVRAGN